MKERVSALESEVGGLTAQLSAYAPDTASLRENVVSVDSMKLLGLNVIQELCVRVHSLIGMVNLI